MKMMPRRIGGDSNETPRRRPKMAYTTKKTKATAKPHKTAAKQEKVAQPTRLAMPSRAEIEQLARQYWAQRGYKDGHAEQDWLRAEQELLQMAS
jgi:hypothetical protein